LPKLPETFSFAFSPVSLLPLTPPGLSSKFKVQGFSPEPKTQNLKPAFKMPWGGILTAGPPPPGLASSRFKVESSRLNPRTQNLKPKTRFSWTGPGGGGMVMSLSLMHKIKVLVGLMRLNPAPMRLNLSWT